MLIYLVINYNQLVNYNVIFFLCTLYSTRIIRIALDNFAITRLLFHQGEESLTKELLDRIHARKQIYIIAGSHQNKIIIRFVVCSRFCQEKDIIFAWNEITSQTEKILEERLHQQSIDTLMKPTDKIASRIETFNLERKDNSQKIT